MLYLRDLSFRYKIPLRGSLLVVVTALLVTASMIAREYDEMQEDLVRNSASLGRVLARTLITPMTHDDLWRAFEIINTPFHATEAALGPQGRMKILVLDQHQRVYVSTQPKEYPVLADPAVRNADLHHVQARLGSLREFDTGVVEPPDTDAVYIVTPIVSDGTALGTLVMSFSRDALLPRFFSIAERAAIVTAGVVVLLIIASWWWARRFAEPLVALAQSMERVGERLPDEGSIKVEESKDEIGRLGTAFRTMVRGLREKEDLKRQVIVSEKLAAIGRLAAAIAHEVNNPLGGMLNTISTLKQHGRIDSFVARNLALLERGLQQIRDTVGAMLVEAKVTAHPLGPHDFEDVRTLVAPEMNARATRLSWSNQLSEELPLPSTLVRQVAINLLLNAADAVQDNGAIGFDAQALDGRLNISVTNDGAHIPHDQVEYVFEPFWSRSEAGHGLGLWVSYQIVTQLGGSIEVSSEPGRTEFLVTIPLGRFA